MEILITGGSGGIGSATARQLDERGHEVAVLDIDEKSLEAMPDDMEKIHSDVTDSAVEDELETRDFDVVVNCHGYFRQGAVEDISIEEIGQHMEVNYLGTFRVIKSILSEIIRRDGKIVNVTSVAGFSVAPYLGPYAASKHAVEACTDALRMELEDTEVDVIMVEPGPVKTGFNQRARKHLENFIPRSRYTEDYRERIQKENGESPESVANTIANAVESENPDARYTNKWKWFVARKSLSLLPKSLSDFLQKRY